MKSKGLILLCVLAGTLLSCEKESPLFVYAYVDGFNWLNTVAEGNKNYRLCTEAKSTTGAAVRHIIISSYDTKYGNQLIVDTVFADPMKSVELKTTYCTTIFKDTTNVEFTVQAYATDGETAKTSLIMVVAPNTEELTQVDNITMYSNLSGKPCCFSVANRTTFMLEDTVDIKDQYFYDVAPKDSSDDLSLIWRSNDLYFARFENFNYAEATSVMIVDAYKSCQRAHTIQDIKFDDILLFGTAMNALGVLKVNYIIDEGERINDRYNFSMKLLPAAKQ